MDTLISNSKYENNSEDDYKAYLSAIDAINIADVDENYIANTIEALGQQIPKYNPVWRSKDYEMLSRSMELVKRMTEYILLIYPIDLDELLWICRETWTDIIQNALFKVIKVTLQSGWTATNSDLIDSMAKILPSQYFEVRLL